LRCLPLVKEGTAMRDPECYKASLHTEDAWK
jgi:hypothetical protein